MKIEEKENLDANTNPKWILISCGCIVDEILSVNSPLPYFTLI